MLKRKHSSLNQRQAVDSTNSEGSEPPLVKHPKKGHILARRTVHISRADIEKSWAPLPETVQTQIADLLYAAQM